MEFEEIIRKRTSVRKFSNKDYTIIFSPYGYDLRKNKDYYLLIDTTNADNIVIPDIIYC